MSTLIVLRGPPACGKTTVAHLLRERLAPAIRLSVDALRYLGLPRVLTPEDLRAAEAGAVDLALRELGRGRTAIVDSVFDDPLTVMEVRIRVEAAGHRVFVVTLRADVEEAVARNAARGPLDAMDAERLREVHTDFPDVPGLVLGTSERLPEEVADAIVGALPRGPSPAPSDAAVLFVRHAQAASPRDRYPDHARLGLSDVGRAQARAARAAVAAFGPTRVVCSPLLRATQTADVLVGAGAYEVDPRVSERVFPALADLSWASIASRHGDVFVDRLRRSPDEISMADCQPVELWQRGCVAAIEEAMDTPEPARLLVVSHGGPHGWWVSHLLGMPLSAQRRIYLAKAHGTLVRWTDPPTLAAMNLSLHEPWGLP